MTADTLIGILIPIGFFILALIGISFRTDDNTKRIKRIEKQLGIYD